MQTSSLAQFIPKTALRVRTGDTELVEMNTQLVLGHPVVSAEQPLLELFTGQHSVLLLPQLIALRATQRFAVRTAQDIAFHIGGQKAGAAVRTPLEVRVLVQGAVSNFSLKKFVQVLAHDVLHELLQQRQVVVHRVLVVRLNLRLVAERALDQHALFLSNLNGEILLQAGLAGTMLAKQHADQFVNVVLAAADATLIHGSGVFEVRVSLV